MISNIFPAVVCSTIMGLGGALLNILLPSRILFQLLSILICGLLYLIIMRLIFNDKLQEVFEILKGKDPCAL